MKAHSSESPISRSISLKNHQNDLDKLKFDRKIKYSAKLVGRKRVKRAIAVPSDQFSDPLWSKSWYLSMENQLSMKIVEAWNMGFTGHNVTITVIDDGLEIDHPDIAPNYDPEASWDSIDDDPEPIPLYDELSTNNHGTRCAGVAAGVANNSMCSVGVAFGARVGAVRMLHDGDIHDADEAGALSFNRDHVDIYSISWGPDDDGVTVEGPRELTVKALEEGARYGRQGKGNIFVWASGNGGLYSDSCACDGYSNSIYTISVGSISEYGTKPWYSEECSSILVSTLSSSSNYYRQISSADIGGQCTEHFSGTSASTSIASGIIALALEANTNLTWRDVQHLLIFTANTDALNGDPTWQTNS